ncbi:MAG: right-handed parallel beta-helix repeat-containing protein [Flavobacteriaceae bacterium]
MYLFTLLCVLFFLQLHVKRTKIVGFLSNPIVLLKYALITCLFLGVVSLHAQTIKYVTVYGNGDKDGSSWNNASNNLQETISKADENTQIWIASGTYTPKVSLAPNKNEQDRNNTFSLKKGVKLYGGFGGGETSLDQRNITTNVTILSGNLGGGNYAHHVILIDALTDNENYYLNGLTISDGRCDVAGYYKISEVINETSVNDQIKDSYPDWYVSMSESPYYQVTSLASQMAGGPTLPAVPGVSDYLVTQETLNTSYPKSNGGGNNIKGVLTLEQVTFRNNTGISGAAISTQEGGKVTINNCTFTNNSTTDNGGAIACSDSYLTIRGGQFTGNQSPLGGAIVDISGKLLDIKDASFTNNQANKTKDDNGFSGAIHIQGVSASDAITRTIDNCTFTNNTAQTAGAISAGENINNLKIINSTFTGNTAMKTDRNTGGGGAVVLNKVMNAEIQTNTFSGNTASNAWGGALLVLETKGNIIISSNNTFTNNKALSGGAVFLFSNSNITLEKNTFTNNKATFNSAYTATGLGGAITTAIDNTVRIFDNNFTTNSASEQGGAINFETSTQNSYINNNTFDGNSSGKYGGAVMAASFTDNSGSSLNINDNTFKKNRATERGGAILLNKAITTTLKKNIFLENESFFGAALDVESTAKTVFFNSTVRGNVATTNSDGYTGGIINAGKGRSDFYNNVFTGNTGFTSVFQANTIISFVNNTVWKPP